MTRESGFVKPSTVRPERLEWGYDGKRHDPTRRINIHPRSMIGDARCLSLEARGLLFSLFLRYWAEDEPREAEILRLEHRLSKRKLRNLIDELRTWKAVKEKDGFLWPMLTFGADPADEVVVASPRYTRNMPEDWSVLRQRVFERDGYGCVYCGSGRDLHCDHVHPLSRGGSNDIGNLVTACGKCNLSKGSKTVAEWRPDIAKALGL